MCATLWLTEAEVQAHTWLRTASEADLRPEIEAVVTES